MKSFKNPEFEILQFKITDIICTSEPTEVDPTFSADAEVTLPNTSKPAY